MTYRHDLLAWKGSPVATVVLSAQRRDKPGQMHRIFSAEGAGKSGRMAQQVREDGTPVKAGRRSCSFWIMSPGLGLAILVTAEPIKATLPREFYMPREIRCFLEFSFSLGWNLGSGRRGARRVIVAERDHTHQE